MKKSKQSTVIVVIYSSMIIYIPNDKGILAVRPLAPPRPSSPPPPRRPCPPTRLAGDAGRAEPAAIFAVRRRRPPRPSGGRGTPRPEGCAAPGRFGGAATPRGRLRPRRDRGAEGDVPSEARPPSRPRPAAPGPSPRPGSRDPAADQPQGGGGGSGVQTHLSHAGPPMPGARGISPPAPRPRPRTPAPPGARSPPPTASPRPSRLSRLALHSACPLVILYFPIPPCLSFRFVFFAVCFVLLSTFLVISPFFFIQYSSLI